MSLSTSDRRALSIGGMIVMPALLLALVGRPYLHETAERRAAIEQEQALYARELGLVRAHASGELALLARQGRDYSRNHMFISRDETLLYARATAYFAAIASSAGVLLEDGAVLTNDSTDTGVRTQDLALRGAGDVGAVLTFLNRVENGPIVMSVERLQLIPNENASAAELSFAADVRVYGAQVN